AGIVDGAGIRAGADRGESDGKALGASAFAVAVSRAPARGAARFPEAGRPRPQDSDPPDR
ncbi:hypothetical protein, partial [Burkholderia oklahomensis]